MTDILITRSEHDPLTRHLSHWNKKVKQEALDKGYEVADLHKEKANRKEFEGRMKKVRPALALLNGHGNSHEVCGQDNEVLVRAGENEDILKGCITYAVACSCAKVLGVKVCDKTETSFIGYDEYFILNLDRKCMANPLKDSRAERFLDPSNRVGISLVKGHTCKEASKNSKKAFRKNILSLLSSSNDPEAIEDAKDLFWNMNHQVCLGNENACL